MILPSGINYAPWYKPLPGTPLNPFHPLARGLVGCWLFNEGGSQINATDNIVHDLSGNNNHGTIKGGGSTYWEPTQKGWALYNASSDDEIEIGDKSLLSNIASSYTLEILIHLNSLFNWNGIFKRAASADATDATQIQLYGFSDGSIRVAHNYFDYYQTFSSVVSANQWTDLVLTWDGSSWRLFVDSLEQSGDSPVGTLTDPSTGDPSFLAHGYSANSMDGKLALCRIYNRTLLPAEIRQLYFYPYAMFRQPVPTGIFYVPAAGATTTVYFTRSLTVNRSIAKPRDRVRSYNRAVTISRTISTPRSLVRAFSRALSIARTLSKPRTRMLDLTRSVTIARTLTKTRDRIINLSRTVGIARTLSKTRDRIINLSRSVALSRSYSRSGQTIVKSYSRAVSIARTFASSVTKAFRWHETQRSRGTWTETQRNRSSWTETQRSRGTWTEDDSVLDPEERP